MSKSSIQEGNTSSGLSLRDRIFKRDSVGNNSNSLLQDSGNIIGNEPNSTALRIKQLSEKLNSGIRAKADYSEKEARQEAIQLRLKVLDQKLSNVQVSDNTRFNAIKDQLDKLQEGLTTEKTTRELLDERKTKELKLLESTITMELNLMKMSHKEVEGKLSQRIDEEFSHLKSALAEERKLIIEADEKYSKEFHRDIQQLESKIEEDRVSSEEESKKFLKAMTEEVQKLEEALGAERKTREESENAMLEMLHDLYAKMQIELQNEKKARESSEEAILKILEQVCDVDMKNSIRAGRK